FNNKEQADETTNHDHAATRSGLSSANDWVAPGKVPWDVTLINFVPITFLPALID
ncbi:hypothetical protein CHS0354_001702, partial [Potamilus streckersoni]